MEASKKSAETVNEIIQILHRGNYTIQEARSILDFTKNRIEHTSKVGESKLTFSWIEGD